jgi:SBF-like CPA transporter family (DUF4137)
MCSAFNGAGLDCVVFSCWGQCSGVDHWVGDFELDCSPSDAAPVFSAGPFWRRRNGLGRGREDCIVAARAVRAWANCAALAWRLGLAPQSLAGANDGIWGQLRARDMAALAAFVLLLLVAALASCWLLGRSLGFSREDRITLLFSGAHKSLATGAPMARILFPGATAGLIIVPLMLYHQLQLIVSAWLAVRLAPANTDAHDQSEKDPRHA